MNGWSFLHPGVLWMALVVPILWWRARAGDRAAPQWTGSISIWRNIVPAPGSAVEKTRRATPWPLVLALLGLTSGIFALAEPQRSPPRERAPSWNLILDRSPSMFLPVAQDAPRTLRIQRAVDLAVDLCESAGVAADAREWTTFAFDGVHASRAARPPAEWLTREWGPGAPTPWERLDDPARVWLVDGGAALSPVRAGLVQTGAAPIPGAIADLGASCLFWDGEQFREQAWDPPRAGVFLAEDLPLDIGTLARLWAQERQLVLAQAGQPACLRIERAPALSGAPTSAGKLFGVGWSADAQAVAPQPAPGERPWAEFESSAARFPAVSWRPGVVRVALAALSAEQADAAAFAVAWAELFDQARLPDPEIVSMLERALAAPPSVHAPPAHAGSAARPAALSAAPWLASLACALVLAALVLASRNLPALSSGKTTGERVRSVARAGLR